MEQEAEGLLSTSPQPVNRNAPLIIAALILVALIPLPYKGCFDDCQWYIWPLALPGFHWIWFALPLTILLALVYATLFFFLLKIFAKKAKRWPVYLGVLILSLLSVVFYKYQINYSTGPSSPLADFYSFFGLGLLFIFAPTLKSWILVPFLSKLPYWQIILISYPVYLVTIASIFGLAGSAAKESLKKIIPRFWEYFPLVLGGFLLIITIVEGMNAPGIKTSAYDQTFNVSSYEDCRSVPEDLQRPKGEYPKEFQSNILEVADYDYELTDSAKKACFMYQAVKQQKPEFCIFENGFYAQNCFSVYLYTHYDPEFCEKNKKIFANRIRDEVIPYKKKYFREKYNQDYIPSDFEVQSIQDACTRRVKSIQKTLEDINSSRRYQQGPNYSPFSR